MYFALNPQQRRRQQQLRELLTERLPDGEVRRLMADPAGDDRDMYAAVTRIASGDNPLDQGSMLEVLGERLYPGAYLSSAVIGAALLRIAGADTLAAEAVAGRLRVTVADKDDSGVITATGVEVTPMGRMSGSRSFVLDAMPADLLLVTGVDAGQVCVAAVEATTTGVGRVPLPGLDQTRKLARIELSDVPCQVLWRAGSGQGTDGGTGDRHPFDVLRLVTQAAVSAEQVGSAQGALDLALDYARERRQFGRAIGSYQAVKHRFADLALLVEQARAAAYQALWMLDCASENAQKAASLARITCTRAATETSEWCMQAQGGRGFRWDNAAHLYLKRAKSTELLFGDPRRERERIAELLALT